MKVCTATLNCPNTHTKPLTVCVLGQNGVLSVFTVICVLQPEIKNCYRDFQGIQVLIYYFHKLTERIDINLDVE